MPIKFGLVEPVVFTFSSVGSCRALAPVHSWLMEQHWKTRLKSCWRLYKLDDLHLPLTVLCARYKLGTVKTVNNGKNENKTG